MIFPPFNEDKSRYERKFLVTDMHYHSIVQQVKLHPSAFSEIFYPRYINNIYLDSNELDFYQDNVTGKGSRKKVRIRWYGARTGHIEKPMLEFKVREGMLGDKISYPLKPFPVDEQFHSEILKEVFENSNLPFWAREILSHLKPTLLNRYKRQYFISFDENFRLTLDEELNYFAIGSHNNYFMEGYSSDDIIVELKYNREFDDDVPAVTKHIPFRLTKSSKYVNGINHLHPALT
jgi:SPX domain protein involved in polyphosphate accumulation